MGHVVVGQVYHNVAQIQQVTWRVEDGGGDTGEEPEERKMTGVSYIEFTVRVVDFYIINL